MGVRVVTRSGGHGVRSNRVDSFNSVARQPGLYRLKFKDAADGEPDATGIASLVRHEYRQDKVATTMAPTFRQHIELGAKLARESSSHCESHTPRGLGAKPLPLDTRVPRPVAMISPVHAICRRDVRVGCYRCRNTRSRYSKKQWSFGVSVTGGGGFLVLDSIRAVCGNSEPPLGDGQ
jgi:hypothetical protein